MPTLDPLRALTKRLLGQMGQASQDYALIEPGDHVMVALSGGKDSYTMLDLLRQLQAKVPFRFELTAVNIDQGHPGFPRHVLEQYLADHDYRAHFVIEDTYSVVKEKVPEGKTYCSLCSRLRRGILYTTAKKLGTNKIALGHHRDDLIETLLLNLMYAGQIRSMPPRLLSDDGDNIVIRPLCYSAEADIAEYARLKAFPILPCDLCGSQDGLKRKQVKDLLVTLERDNPKLRGNLFAALGNVRASTLLGVERGESTETTEPAQGGGRRLRVLPSV